MSNELPLQATPMRQERLLRRLKIRQLAILCGTTEAAISRYETGRRVPYPAMRERIARELDSTPQYLWPAAYGLDSVAS